MKQESENTLKDPRKNGEGRKTVDEEKKKSKKQQIQLFKKEI